MEEKAKKKIDKFDVFTFLFIVGNIIGIGFVIIVFVKGIINGEISMDKEGLIFDFKDKNILEIWKKTIALLILIDLPIFAFSSALNNMLEVDRIREEERIKEQRQRVKNRTDERLKKVAVDDIVYIRFSSEKIVPITVTDVRQKPDKAVFVYGYSDSDTFISTYTAYEMGIEAFLTQEEALRGVD